jgi:hypothetical protein
MATDTLDARSLAAATPDTRDRFVDLLRLGSIVVVVVGHWMMADLVVGPNGLRAGNSLQAMPAMQPLTWVLQVVPLFFFCGGIAHAHVLRRPHPYGAFLASRTGRILPPMLAFLAVWSSFAVAVELGGLDGGVMAVALRVVTQPLWFLGVYFGVIAAAPGMHRLHQRHGWRVLGVLAAVVALTDLVRFATANPTLGALNVAAVWLGVHQLGFAYADGSLGRRQAKALFVGGLATMGALLIAGPYPVSMVGMPGASVSNMNPPTAALAAQATWLVGLAVLARPALDRWLQRPRVWLVVVAGNGVVMSLFLWHLTGLFAVEIAGRALGVHTPPAGSAAWWTALPVRMLAAAAVTAALVVAARRAEHPRPALPSGRSGAAPFAGLVAALAGTLILSATGLAGLVDGHPGHLLGVPVTAMSGLVLLVVGSSSVRPWRSA